MTSAIHRSELLNVSITSTSPVHSLRSPRSPGLSIEPVDLNLSHTAEELDEKRENRKVYDYLCRLLEVRLWLVEILQTPDIPDEIELEANLSNGVLLARLANSFAPDVVPVSKIYDIDQTRYKRDGQPCYRHTDNIVLWRKAVCTVRLPEILLPETVDVYEGRNINTIFCLYALAIHLFRLRRGPPIRNQAGNVEFEPAVMENMRERLKDSNIPAFSDVGGILTTTPGDKDALSVAILRLNRSIGNNEELLKALKNPDIGILFVNERLIYEYQRVLREHKELAGEDLSRAHVQMVVTNVNEADALRRLDEMIMEREDFNLIEMTVILDDLQQEGVMQHALPVYAKLIRAKRREQHKPLNAEQVEKIIECVNACVRVKFFVLEEDREGLFEVLSHPSLNCQDIVRQDLKPIYLDLLREEYSNTERHYIVLPNRIRVILLDARDSTPQQRVWRKISMGIENDNNEQILEALEKVDGFNPQYQQLYLIWLRNAPLRTIDDVQNIVRKTNLLVLAYQDKAREAVQVNKMLINGKRKEAEDIIEVTWSELVKRDYSVHYGIVLEEELLTRRRKFLKEANEGQQFSSPEEVENLEYGYLPYKFEGGVLYVNAATNEVTFEKPVNINEWMLRSDDIERIIENENKRKENEEKAERERAEGLKKKAEEQLAEMLRKKAEEERAEMLRKKADEELKEKLKRKAEEDLAEAKRREEAALKIQRWLRRHQLRRDLYELRHSDAPSLRVVRNFISILVSTKDDVEEEAEIEDNKSNVTKLINANRHLDEQLQELDGKIALLVKNRINLQEVIEHGNKVNEEADAAFMRKGSVRKKDREQWNAYEMIIFHLQTEPEYLTKIIQEYKSHPDVLTDFLKRAMLPMFNFAAEEREEYLLASLFRFIIKQEILKLPVPEDLRKTFAVPITRLLIDMLADKNVKKPKLAELRRQLEEKENIIQNFNLNVENIYEGVEGHRATSIREAANNESVRRVLESSKNFLTKWSTLFAEAAFEKSTRLPRILHFLINGIYIDMKERFPRVTHGDIMQGIAGWMYKSCWEEQIIDNGKKDDEQFDEQIEKRKTISKFIEFGVVNIGYGDDKWYLTSLNETMMLINSFAMQLLTPIVEEETDVYHRDKYSDVLSKHRPTLHISLPQLNYLHRHLKDNIGLMIPNGLSRFRQLIEDTTPPNADLEIFVTLLLHPMPLSIPSEQQKDPRELFQRTKRYIVECLLCDCPGENLTVMLERHTLETEEQKYKDLPRPEESPWTLAEQKRQILENLNNLQLVGLVQASNHYQAIVTDIAKDINREQEYRNERRAQLHHLRSTVIKLQEQRKESCDRLAAYREYLDKCLDNMTVTSKRPSIRPDSVRAGKIIKERQSLDAIKKIKCSAEKLDKKGILLSVDNYNTFKEYSKMSMEISTTDRPGILSFTINEPKKAPEICEVDFQDLLRAEYNEEPSLKIAGRVNLHVQKLIAFINKKFYSQ